MEAYDINDLIEFLRFPSISADTQFKPQIEACADWLMKTNANSAASLEPSTHAEDFASNSSRAAFLPVRNYWSKRFLIVPLLSTFALLTPTVSLAQQPTTMSAKSVAKLPFSPGLELGDTLYVSGHLGVDSAVGKAPDDPEEEARQVLHSVELTLKEAGMSMDDLVYVEIYCTDLKLYGAFNKAYASTLKSPYPARDFIGVKDLLFGAHFELMGIAVRNASQNKRQPLAVK